ncbi:MAG: hypothetical protein GY774_16565 [Planctomycetes bacterium]|nr:hypothetical protein [Planctomycetota bacterium]
MTTKKKKKARKAKDKRRQQEPQEANQAQETGQASSLTNNQSLTINHQLQKALRQSTSGWQIHPNDGQGIYTKYFKSYVPRKVEADFYEFLREAIPIIDAAIQRLTELDGHLIVTGDSDALTKEIEEWMDNITVNDIQKGILAFDQNHTSEAHEQGFSISEFVANKKRNDIVGLRVADSKFIKFRRISTGLEISQKGNDDNDYRVLKPENLMYFSINNENQNPYGTALMRSCEFVSKIIATIQNTTLNLFERFGDPAYKLIYKTSKKDGKDHTARVTEMKTDLTTAITAKRAGKSADFVYAIDKDSSIDISVLGADNKQVLEFKEPMRSATEYIVAKTGIAPWMLGLHWSTTARLSDAEANMILAAVATRQAAKKPLYVNLIRNLLLLRGRTWKPGDWNLEWAQINLHDIVKQAQAKFLTAQAEMMQPEKSDKSANSKGAKSPAHTCCSKHATPASKLRAPSSELYEKELSRPTPWPELDEVEDNYEKELKYDWSVLTEQIFTFLNLPVDELVTLPKPTPREEQLTNPQSEIRNPKSKAPGDIPEIEAFTFSAEQQAAIMKELETFKGKYDWKDTDSAVRWYYGQSYSLGLLQAANLIGKDRPILDIIKNSETYDKLSKEGFKLVKDNATKDMVNKIIPEMEAQALAGANPRHVAARLKSKFEDSNSDWERLARTEMSVAAERAKLDEWKAWDIDTSNAVIAGLDTHPRCRCGNNVEERNGKFVVVFVPAPDACPICLSAAN